MPLRPRRVARALLLLPLLAAGASAQERPALSIAAPPVGRATETGPVVQVRQALAAGRTRELLQAGFPARLHFTLELWRQGGMFDDLEGRVEWDLLVTWRAVERRYEVLHIVRDRPFSLGRFERLADAEAALARPVRAPITAPVARQPLYYQARVAIETLSLTDLDEVERWLRGELRPATTGRRNPGTALGRGVRTITARLLGGERRELSARTPLFDSP